MPVRSRAAANALVNVSSMIGIPGVARLTVRL
jgi:hypothetical protein